MKHLFKTAAACLSIFFVYGCQFFGSDATIIGNPVQNEETGVVVNGKEYMFATDTYTSSNDNGRKMRICGKTYSVSQDGALAIVENTDWESSEIAVTNSYSRAKTSVNRNQIILLAYRLDNGLYCKAGKVNTDGKISWKTLNKSTVTTMNYGVGAIPTPCVSINDKNVIFQAWEENWIINYRAGTINPTTYVITWGATKTLAGTGASACVNNSNEVMLVYSTKVGDLKAQLGSVSTSRTTTLGTATDLGVKSLYNHTVTINQNWEFVIGYSLYGYSTKPSYMSGTYIPKYNKIYISKKVENFVTLKDNDWYLSSTMSRYGKMSNTFWVFFFGRYSTYHGLMQSNGSITQFDKIDIGTFLIYNDMVM